MNLMEKLAELTTRRAALRKEDELHTIRIEGELEKINMETKALIGFCDGEALTIEMIAGIAKAVKDDNE